MQAILYNIDDPLNKVVKTLTNGTGIDISLKNVSNVNSFSVVLKNDKPDFNYVHFPKLGYYFVSDIEVVNNKLNRYYLEIDVLMTYSDIILNSNCRYKRSLKTGDTLSININQDAFTAIELIEGDVKLENVNNAILTVVGG